MVGFSLCLGAFEEGCGTEGSCNYQAKELRATRYLMHFAKRPTWNSPESAGITSAFNFLPVSSEGTYPPWVPLHAPPLFPLPTIPFF